jgi:hypothetical protein
LKYTGIAPFLLGAIALYLEDAIMLFFRKCDRVLHLISGRKKSLVSPILSLFSK